MALTLYIHQRPRNIFSSVVYEEDHYTPCRPLSVISCCSSITKILCKKTTTQFVKKGICHYLGHSIAVTSTGVIGNILMVKFFLKSFYWPHDPQMHIIIHLLHSILNFEFSGNRKPPKRKKD